MDPPKAKAAPPADLFASFLDSTQYRIMVDYKLLAPGGLARFKATDFSGYEIDPALERIAGSQYFTHRVTFQSNASYEAQEKRYAQHGNAYEMVKVGRQFRSERVERPAN